MNIILEEAKSRNMQVWILDDSHFSTGFCNVEMEKANPSLRRFSLVHKFYSADKNGRPISTRGFLKAKYRKAKGTVLDDKLVGISAINQADTKAEPINLMDHLHGDKIVWTHLELLVAAKEKQPTGITGNVLLKQIF